MSTKVEEKTEVKEKTEETKPVTLQDISQLGRVVKSKEVLKGVKVTLQTLSASHQQKILSTLPPQSADPISKFTILQVETLALSTVELLGKQYTEADREDLRSVYSEMQNKVLQHIYGFYLDIVDEQNGVIDSLKKT